MSKARLVSNKMSDFQLSRVSPYAVESISSNRACEGQVKQPLHNWVIVQYFLRKK